MSPCFDLLCSITANRPTAFIINIIYTTKPPNHIHLLHFKAPFHLHHLYHKYQVYLLHHKDHPANQLECWPLHRCHCGPIYMNWALSIAMPCTCVDKTSCKQPKVDQEPEIPVPRDKEWKLGVGTLELLAVCTKPSITSIRSQSPLAQPLCASKPLMTSSIYTTKTPTTFMFYITKTPTTLMFYITTKTTTLTFYITQRPPP